MDGLQLAHKIKGNKMRSNIDVVSEFHKKFYNEGDEIYGHVTYMGIPTLKCPLDLWIYQEIIWEYRPDVIIETGTYLGGSTLFLADTLKNAEIDGTVFAIDIVDKVRPLIANKNNNIRFIWGSSTNIDLVDTLYSMVGGKNTLVILDSIHTKEHVLDELNIYSRFIKPNGYIIVEDTNLNGHPVRNDWGDGPMEAVNEFLIQNSDFMIDSTKEKFLMTFNPRGYLKKKERGK